LFEGTPGAVPDNNHLATSRSNITHNATLSTYRASTTRVHGTCSVAVGYKRRPIRSATSRVPHRLPRLWTEASFRSPGSASPPKGYSRGFEWGLTKG
jgi:hypothetical protein